MTTLEQPPLTAVQEAAYHQLIDMLGFRWKWSALVVAVRLNIASHLIDGPLTIEELAERTAVHAPSLQLLLQFLAYSGIFIEPIPGTFAQTERSAVLRADVPQSAYHLLLMQGSEWHSQAWAALGVSLATDHCAFEHVYQQNIWHYFATHPAEKQVFDNAMVGVSQLFDQAIIRAYAFDAVQQIVDIGGGRGTFLQAVLETFPTMHGTLFDLAPTIESIQPLINGGQLAGRYTTQSGDFFQSVPAGADTYVLKQILHDWNDKEALKILKNCRAAMLPTSRLLIAEMSPRSHQTPRPQQGVPPFVGFLELQMRVLFGGQERNESHFRHLLAQADLMCIEIVQTQSPFWLFVCVPTTPETNVVHE